MFHRDQVLAAMLLLAPMASGQAGELAATTGDLATVRHAPAVVVPGADDDDDAPLRVVDGLGEAAISFHDIQDFGSSGGPENGALSSILIGLALLCAAGPLGRLISGLEHAPRPRRSAGSRPPG